MTYFIESMIWVIGNMYNGNLMTQKRVNANRVKETIKKQMFRTTSIWNYTANEYCLDIVWRKVWII